MSKSSTPSINFFLDWLGRFLFGRCFCFFPINASFAISLAVPQAIVALLLVLEEGTFYFFGSFKGFG